MLEKIQQELKAPKNQYNAFWKYKYRSTEDILEGLKPLLKEYECYIHISDELVNIWERYYVKATASLKNKEWKIIDLATGFAREEENKKWMDWSQITWASSSYARKYALNWLFAIDDTKDSDVTNKWEEAKKQTVKLREFKKEEIDKAVTDIKNGKYNLNKLLSSLNNKWEKLSDDSVNAIKEQI